MTRVVKVGSVSMGGGNPITVQSMCDTLTKNVKITVNQILELEDVGCELIRVAVPDMVSVKSLKEIKKQINIPLIADIHFDHKLALASIPYVDKIRINPGNIGNERKVKEIIEKLKEYNVPVRIGANSGSVEKEFSHLPRDEALVKSTMKWVRFFEENEFYNLVIAIKASTVMETIKANKAISTLVDYPLHIGVTEAGTRYPGLVKSSVGIGSLLSQGIGDTIRVSLTANPIEEIRAGIEILKALGLRKGKNIISCPTCARSGINVKKIAEEIDKKTKNLNKEISIAVMGCAVNGPGEAKHADIGIAGGKNCVILFKKGKIIKKIDEKEAVNALLKEIDEVMDKN
ncbi:MAG: flavodoxin-dependent (E)-4-hydroxy-3-methylbut-2-enyl-diphosphate synthase [Nanoarchaeota archaeon]|nr:flavodoxin-dependent (E)-4-hydroxy-3-methylbut-2-enyl-diphosphate synthase [Nanoarchaeota archaeon]